MPAGKRPASRKRWSATERDARAVHGQLIAGVDEVGRGPLAGPVVACAVIMPPDARAIGGVDDSKLLTAAERTRLAVKIRARAITLGVGAASVREIDRVNIYHATVLAMRRALGRLGTTPNHVLVDGRPIRSLRVPHTAVVCGDRKCYSIACASIIAKVTRDRLMLALARRYPQYCWERNVGYGTPEHWTSVNEHGLSPHHRRTFIHPRQLVLDLDMPADVVDDDLVPSLEELVSEAMLPTPIVVRNALRFDLGDASDPIAPETQ
jgi:ribonuclease HII